MQLEWFSRCLYIILEKSAPLQKQHDTFIGFSAWAQSTQLVEVGDPVQFSGVLANVGEYYNEDTGVFTCPDEGVYYVSVTITQFELGGFSLRVTRLGESQETLLTFFSTQIANNVVSNSAVFGCSAGDSVYVEGVGESSQVYGNTNLPQTVFTVILMNVPGKNYLLKKVTQKMVLPVLCISYMILREFSYVLIYFTKPVAQFEDIYIKCA